MLPAALIASGLFAIVYGCLRGYAATRAALLPFVRGGDPTRTLVESAQPVHARPRVRLAARHVLVALGWIAVAMYGTLLVTVGLETLA
jgi:hypothetical protein